MYFSTCLQPLFIFRYKLWHYTGKLLDERRVSELWEVKHLSLLMCTMIYTIDIFQSINFFFGRLSGNLFQMESLRSQLLTTVLRCLPRHKNNRKVSVIAVSYSLNKKKQIYLVLFSNEKIKYVILDFIKPSQ